MSKSVVIKGGRVILDDDYILRRSRRWHVNSDGYVRDSKGVALHRELVGAPARLVVDHINHNPLDNRRANLRVCTQQQNLWNGRAHRDGTSRYRGVSWNKSVGKWRAQIQGKTIGHFADEEAAAAAYNAEAARRFGEFAPVPGAGVEPARA